MKRQFFSGNSLEQAVMLAARHFGIEPENVAVMPVNLSHRAYAELPARQFYAALADRLRALPGVESVALAQTVLLGPVRSYDRPEPEGYEHAVAELPLIGILLLNDGRAKTNFSKYGNKRCINKYNSN